MSTCYDVVLAYSAALVANPEWRRGAAAFNALAELHPALAEEVRGTALDPFHRDEIGTRFWEFIAERLDATPQHPPPRP